MFGEYSRGELVCTYAKSGALPHLCTKEHIGVCLCVCACVLSAKLPDGCYLRESDGQGKLARHADRLKCYSPPETSIRPKEICHVVPPF